MEVTEKAPIQDKTLMPTENLKKLHDNLAKRDGFNVPYEQFEKDMQADGNLKRLHDNLSKQGDFTVPYDQFKVDMFQPEPITQQPVISATESLHSSIPFVHVNESDQSKTQVVGSIPGDKPEAQKQVSFDQNKTPKVGDESNMDNILPQAQSKEEKYYQSTEDKVGGAQINSNEPEYSKFTEHPIDNMGQHYDDFIKSGVHNTERFGAEIAKGLLNYTKNPINNNPLFPGANELSEIGNNILDDWKKTIPKDPDNAATKAGAIVPYVGLAIASILQPELAPATTAIWFTSGTGEGLNHADEVDQQNKLQHDQDVKEGKATGDYAPMSELKRQAYGVGYGTANTAIAAATGHLLSLPVGSFITKSLLRSSPELIAGLEGTLKSFAEQTPKGIGQVLNVGKQYAIGAAKSSAGMFAMTGGKLATNKALGEDVGINDIVNAAKESIISGVAFESILFPFGHIKQTANTIRRRESQGTVAISIVDGKPAEIYQSGDKYYAVSPKGITREAKAEDYHNSIIIPTDVFNRTIETKTVSPTIQRDVYSGRIVDMLNRISDTNGTVRVAQDTEGNSFYAVNTDKQGNTIAIDSNGQTGKLDPNLSIKAINKGAVYNSLMAKYDEPKLEQQESQKAITTATIEGQQFTVNNPGDLGIKGKPIFAKDAEGKVTAVANHKATDPITQTQGEIDQSQQQVADNQALMNGITDPNAQMNIEYEGPVTDREGNTVGQVKVIDFSNGQTKVIFNDQEVIANNINEKDVILNSIVDYQKLPESKTTDQGHIIEPAPERNITTQKFGNVNIDMIKNEDHHEVVPSDKMPLEKALPILEKKFKDNPKFDVVAEKVQVETPGKTIKAENDFDDDVVEPSTFHTVVKSIKIMPKSQKVAENNNSEIENTDNVSNIQKLNTEIQNVENTKINNSSQINQHQNEEPLKSSSFDNNEPGTIANQGEVKSRNVQSRMNMTPEERREQLLSEIQDVAEDQKIYLQEAIDKAYPIGNKPSFKAIKERIDQLQAIAPNAAPVEIIADKNGFPDRVKNDNNFSDNVQAVWFNNKIYILANKVGSIDEVIGVWIHENGIHNGLRNIIPSGEFKQFVGKVYDSFIEAGKGNPMFQRIIDRVNKDYSYASKEEKAEEFLAYLSEKVVNEEDLTPMEQSLWRKYLGMFRDFLKRLFNFNSQLLTEKQITEITRFAVQSNFQYYEHGSSNQIGRRGIRERASNNTDGSERSTDRKFQDSANRGRTPDVRQGRILAGNNERLTDSQSKDIRFQIVQDELNNITSLPKSNPVKKALHYFPGYTELREGVKTFAHSIKVTLSPYTHGEGGKIGSEIMREKLGQMQRKLDQSAAQLQSASKAFDKMSNDDNLKFIDNMERGLPQKNKVLQSYSDALREALDEARIRVKMLGTGKLDEFIENYFPHNWTDPVKAGQLNGVGKRPMEGSKAFLKKRTIEFTIDGVNNGLIPISWNPVKLALIKLREMERYTMAHRTLNELKDLGYVKFVRIGQPRPDGFKDIDDKVGKVMYKNASGALEYSGNYLAEENVARIINNFLSKGLRGKLPFDIYRGLGNLFTQFQLGLSAFHVGFTSMDATISKAALGLEYLYHGKVVQALKHFAEAPIAPVTNLISGDKLLKAWLGNPSSVEMASIAEFMETAGGRAKMDDFYKENFRDKLIENFRNKKFLSAGLQVPLHLVELLSKPIMEYIVPRQKLGVFMDMVRYDLEVNPDASPVERRKNMQNAWNSVDNRMGQMVYDNLFWNHITKDAAMATVRSVGWNLGTFREVGGAPEEAGNIFLKALRGKHADDTHKVAYFIALMMFHMIYSAIWQYLRTGSGPDEIKDYFFPKNGGIDSKGDPTREVLPTYVKDLYHYTTAPVQTLMNKLSPVNGLVYQTVKNKDYYGTKIWNEDDPLTQKGLDYMKYMGSQLIPFGIRNAQKNEDGDMASKVLPFVGITPAPYDLNMTKAEEKINEIIQQKLPVGARTKEQADQSKVRSKVRNQFTRSKDESVIDKAIDGGLISEKEGIDILDNAELSPIERSAKKLNAEELYGVYKIASDKEKELLAPILLDKAYNKYKVEDDEDDLTHLDKIIDEVEKEFPEFK